MKVLLVGVGGVGEAIAVVAKGRPWLERMVLADLDRARAEEVVEELGGGPTFVAERVDASKRTEIMRLARTYGVDLIVNAVEPVYDMEIFEAAFQVGATYMDMAMSLSRPHPTAPYRQTGVMLGDEQFARAADWEAKGLLALLGMGVEPGMSDVFAAYAAKHLFHEIHEIGVRDGANLEVRGYTFAPNFSIWTAIEECLNPPVVWEKERGWFTTETFSEPEVFEFPEGIGPIECVNVEHEEVILIPRAIDVGRVTFKYGLGTEFIDVLKTLHMLGLDEKEPVEVKGVRVAPRDVVASRLPDPAHLGDLMTGKTCAGTWVRGMRDGTPREVYLYQVADNEECMRAYGVQAVVWQTAVNPVIAMELLADGVWKGAGVMGPEAFDPDPFVERMPAYDFPFGIKEMTPGVMSAA
ncbi:MAG TPA: saccharopine dehydrogenase C-terminal domain-containing protein [Actinomycetota bacterium]|jgi:saccharopine dehydrogenase-like NADP-dependent oxidoreductase